MQQVDAVQAALGARLPHSFAIYYDEAQAWKLFLEEMQLSDSTLSGREGVVSSYLSLHFDRPPADHDYEVLDGLKSEFGAVNRVLYDRPYSERVATLLYWLKGLQIAALLVGILVITLILNLTLRFLMNRSKREIRVLYMLGASRAYVALNFRYYLAILLLFMGLISGIIHFLVMYFFPHLTIWDNLSLVFIPRLAHTLWLLGMVGTVAVVAFCLLSLSVRREYRLLFKEGERGFSG